MSSLYYKTHPLFAVLSMLLPSPQRSFNSRKSTRRKTRFTKFETELSLPFSRVLPLVSRPFSSLASKLFDSLSQTMAGERTAFRPQRPRQSLGALPSVPINKENSTSTSSEQPTSTSTWRKRAQSLGGEQLEQARKKAKESLELSPSKKLRRGLVRHSPSSCCLDPNLTPPTPPGPPPVHPPRRSRHLRRYTPHDQLLLDLARSARRPVEPHDRPQLPLHRPLPPAFGLRTGGGGFFRR